MGRIWTDENKFRAWLEVETVASEVLAEDGIVPAEAAKAIRERGGFDRRAHPANRSRGEARRDRFHDRGGGESRAGVALAALSG